MGVAEFLVVGPQALVRGLLVLVFRLLGVERGVGNLDSGDVAGVQDQDHSTRLFLDGRHRNVGADDALPLALAVAAHDFEREERDERDAAELGVFEVLEYRDDVDVDFSAQSEDFCDPVSPNGVPCRVAALLGGGVILFQEVCEFVALLQNHVKRLECGADSVLLLVVPGLNDFGRPHKDGSHVVRVLRVDVRVDSLGADKRREADHFGVDGDDRAALHQHLDSEPLEHRGLTATGADGQSPVSLFVRHLLDDRCVVLVLAEVELIRAEDVEDLLHLGVPDVHGGRRLGVRGLGLGRRLVGVDGRGVLAGEGEAADPLPRQTGVEQRGDLVLLVLAASQVPGQADHDPGVRGVELLREVEPAFEGLVGGQAEVAAEDGPQAGAVDLVVTGLGRGQAACHGTEQGCCGDGGEDGCGAPGRDEPDQHERGEFDADQGAGGVGPAGPGAQGAGDGGHDGRGDAVGGPQSPPGRGGPAGCPQGQAYDAVQGAGAAPGVGLDPGGRVAGPGAGLAARLLDQGDLGRCQGDGGHGDGLGVLGRGGGGLAGA
ncbi:hypothetical protein [Streptomyces sp. FBKL.4005]|uniref:hypothetical protein n=1 Tax=Streptomyces sp. FBKL.4005 TaxID=2015515 RepID=UPI00117F4FD8|nr:hypothetical protein [Streptomyces sp. FBKL.4005]